MPIISNNLSVYCLHLILAGVLIQAHEEGYTLTNNTERIETYVLVFGRCLRFSDNYRLPGLEKHGCHVMIIA